MSQEEQSLPKKKIVSVKNWIGTLLLSAIPGVNIVFFILTIIFAKSRAKHNYALAALTLTILFVLLICLAFLFFGDRLVEYARKLSESIS